jgi:hypothetical protein
VVALGGHGAGWGKEQSSILLERLVIGFHIPSFAIECGDLVVGEFKVYDVPPKPSVP